MTEEQLETAKHAVGCLRPQADLMPDNDYVNAQADLADLVEALVAEGVSK